MVYKFSTHADITQNLKTFVTYVCIYVCVCFTDTYTFVCICARNMFMHNTESYKHICIHMYYKKKYKELFYKVFIKDDSRHNK